MRGVDMKNYKISKVLFSFLIASFVLSGFAYAQESTSPEVCFESRGMKNEDGEVVGYTIREKRDVEPGWPNIKCSTRTGGVLWWGDPFDETEPMGELPIEADYTYEEAVVKPRTEHLTNVIGLYPCADMCHGDPEIVAVPKDTTPRELVAMHTEKAQLPTDLKHGRGAIWCLDCHSRTNRNMLIDHRGNEISFNQPMKLCGKCHGQIYRDWRDGIHGKRIGMWVPGGKKRWWVCTECHDPHNVQQLPKNRGFAQLQPEPAPELPKGMVNTAHEQEHGHGGGHAATTGHSAGAH